jgi:hypothetical protein
MGVRLSPLIHRPLLGLLYQSRMVNEHETVNEIKIGKENRSTRRDHAVVPLRSPQFTYDLIWDLTQVTAVGIWRLIFRVTAI